MPASYAKISFDDILDRLIDIDPSHDLDCIVIIPAYAEEDVLTTLDSLQFSLASWSKEDVRSSRLEVILLINQSEGVDPDMASINERSFQSAIGYDSRDLCLHVIYIYDCPQKKAGVGLARRLAMDEAAKRLLSFGRNHDGLIVNLDADCTVSSNYLAGIRSFMDDQDQVDLANIHIEHDLSTALNDKAKDAILDYELHLRYFIGMQRWLGLPYACQTIGSAFVVRAGVYVQMGRMNTRKAGEDFYYIHKFTKKGTVADLNNVIVYPSSRSSFRVPFGTGKAVADILSNDMPYKTYHPQSFYDLSALVNDVDRLYQEETNLDRYPDAVATYLKGQDFETVIVKLKSNARSLRTFRKAFFQWFDAFRLMKYLHEARDSTFSSVAVLRAIKQSVKELEVPFATDKVIMLSRLAQKHIDDNYNQLQE